MALPEGYLARKGDIVQLYGTVEYDQKKGNDRVFVEINGVYSSASVAASELHLKTRAWRIGEEVMPINLHESYERPATVLGLHGEYVWIDDPVTGPSTYHANSIMPWTDPKAPLIADGAAVRELTEVQEAMKEPPPAPVWIIPPHPGSSAAVGDDEPF